MAKDDRLYGKFTLDFPDHPKIAILSDAAFRALVEATLWCRSQLNDGFIPKRYAVARWSLNACCELTENDADAPSFIETEQTYFIHDFAEHQTTKAEVDAVKTVRRAAGRLGGLASGEARRSKTEAKPKQTPSKTNPETETETELLDPYGSSVLAGGPARQRALDTAPPPAAPAPEKNLPPPNKCGPDEFYEQLETQNCQLCDNEGYRPNGAVCDHIDRTQTVKNGMAQIRAALQKKPQPL